MFLSIFAATCRPNNITLFLDNLAETADDLSSFEVLIKIDEGADDLRKILDEYQKTAGFRMRYLELPKLDGYYTLDVGYNELFTIADPDTYFCWLLTDEIRLKTKGWDTILKKYIGFYPDDIFRIKLSIFRLKNYIAFFECLPAPDNYAVTTRKWLEITGGWGHFWGPDARHQCIDFYLMLSKNKQNPYGIWRSFPVFDIDVGGQEAGLGIEDPKKLAERSVKIWEGWAKHSSHAAQENFNKLALRLNLYLEAFASGKTVYFIQEDLAHKKIGFYDEENKACVDTMSYALPAFKWQIFSGYKRISIRHPAPTLYRVCVWTAYYVKRFLSIFIDDTNRTLSEMMREIALSSLGIIGATIRFFFRMAKKIIYFMIPENKKTTLKSSVKQLEDKISKQAVRFKKVVKKIRTNITNTLLTPVIMLLPGIKMQEPNKYKHLYFYNGETFKKVENK